MRIISRQLLKAIKYELDCDMSEIREACKSVTNI